MNNLLDTSQLTDEDYRMINLCLYYSEKDPENCAHFTGYIIGYLFGRGLINLETASNLNSLIIIYNAFYVAYLEIKDDFKTDIDLAKFDFSGMVN